MRMYLFEVISAIQIIQQDLQDYEDENLWNYNGFEDNYNLENMLYSYFLMKRLLNIGRIYSHLILVKNYQIKIYINC